MEEVKFQEMDTFFKKTANDYFTKVRELEDTIKEQKDEAMVLRFENKIHLLESDLIELKNYTQGKKLRSQNVNWTQDANEKLDVLIEETN